MSIGPLRVAAFSCAALFSLGFAQTQADEKKAAPAGQAGEACFSGVQTALDAAGMPIVLSTKQLDERATRRVLPKYPALLRQANFATHGRIKLLIAPSGEVTCAVALSGHPLVLPNVLDAIKQWRFLPYKVDGTRVSVLGHFDFCFSTSGCPFMDLPHTSGQ
jgi:Gram-negative bacterial TonB protein C-terminal